MKKYLEIVEFVTGNAVKRIDVTNQSESEIQRIERGFNINLNHEKYFTSTVESSIELELR